MPNYILRYRARLNAEQQRHFTNAGEITHCQGYRGTYPMQNYDRDELKEIAEEAGVKFMSGRWSVQQSLGRRGFVVSDRWEE
jgi:hypothetical protein